MWTLRSWFCIKVSPTKADHTAAGWEVDDVEKIVKDLREKGVYLNSMK